MGNELSIDYNEIVKKLSVKIGELEANLAFERTLNEVYAKRIEELSVQERTSDDEQ